MSQKMHFTSTCTKVFGTSLNIIRTQVNIYFFALRWKRFFFLLLLTCVLFITNPPFWHYLHLNFLAEHLFVFMPHKLYPYCVFSFLASYYFLNFYSGAPTHIPSIIWYIKYSNYEYKFLYLITKKKIVQSVHSYVKELANIFLKTNPSLGPQTLFWHLSVPFHEFT